MDSPELSLLTPDGRIDPSRIKLDTTIEEFFTKEEYQNICDMERQRLRNIRLNYEAMLNIGLPIQMPEFMRPKKRSAKRTEQYVRSEQESDEEWRPRPKRQTGAKSWRPPYRPPSATVTSAQTSNQTSKKTGAVKRTRSQKEKAPAECRVYSLRKRKEVNYMKLEVPNDDEFIYCEDCDQEYHGDCPEHGAFHVVDDTPVPWTKRGDPQRAVKTLPTGLEVRQSGIPDAGQGVFAAQFFPNRSRFGPYQGRRVTDHKTAHTSGYCWQIVSDEGFTYFVDAKDCKAASWMRFVNCARTREEQNVTAYQHCGEIYYRAHQDIQPGAEILVWYGAEYGRELGIIRDDDEKTQRKRKKQTAPVPDDDEEEEDEGRRTCSDSDVRTSDVDFTDSEDDHKSKPKCTPVKKAKVVKPSTQPSSVDPKSNRASALKPTRSHVCQRCSAAFVLFNSLKLHAKFVHQEKIQAEPPVSTTADRCEVGHHGGGKEGGEASRKKHVQRRRNSLAEIGRGQRDGENGKRRHVCDVCSKAFTNAGHLKTHTLIHTGEKPFVCSVCSEAFNQAGNLKKHTLVHTGEKPFVCSVCSKAFTLVHNLKSHTLIHTGEKPFVCSVCSKAFNQAGHLKAHQRLHTEERPYKCPHCEADFNQSGNLQLHIRSVHAGDRPYVCDVCGTAFSHTGHLERHKRIHTGEKPHVCSDCGKAFSRTGNLETHKRTHTGEKPHVCSDCGKGFSDHGNLRRHHLTHTGEKPHVCSDCGKGFSDRSNLRKHRLTHTGEKPHPCPHCPAAFTRPDRLKKHIEKVHQ